MSLLRRALRSVGLRVGKDRFLVGTDLEGNAFYERPHPEYPDEWRKNKRYVEYRVTRYLSDYNFHTIPVQWSSWLRRTRREPPSLPELEKDYYRQLRLQQNVEQLRLAYEEEKLRLQERNQDALFLSEGEHGNSFEEGLPKNDTGIGAKEAEIGKHLGLKDQAPAPQEAETTSPTEEVAKETPSDEDLAKQRREEEREAARKRREEFARNAPPTGNPSDSFQPQGWSSPAPAKRR
ncbi:uncharacterized protein JCM6883_001934 [Sporobolomyces salmoneus]|uniref:uncharacterized protein n=1 Tax=Sporobolomyces salmoneus TaxID=183962 RepID=UPI00317EDCD4